MPSREAVLFFAGVFRTGVRIVTLFMLKTHAHSSRPGLLTQDLYDQFPCSGPCIKID